MADNPAATRQDGGMQIDRRNLLGLAAASATVLSGGALAQSSSDDGIDIRLWPRGAPGGEVRPVLKPEVIERSTVAAYHDRFAQHTTQPLMTLFRAPKPDGSAMLLIPGGGYKWAVVDKEGVDIARPFTEAGITCFVLRYRLPADGWRAGPDAPLQDAQRAMRLIRSRAATYGIDPKRIGMLGASAGGHLGASLMSLHDKLIAPAEDVADTISARPDLAALLYPVVTMADPYVHAGSRTELLGSAPTRAQIAAYSRERSVTGGEPPIFLVHALDDPAVPVENSLMLIDSLRRAQVPLETHLFEEGGHGFGIRLAAGKPASIWPELFLTWARRRHFLRTA